MRPLTISDYLLLESLESHSMPLWVFLAYNASQHLNLPLDLDRRDTCDRLKRLIRHGLIELWRDHTGGTLCFEKASEAIDRVYLRYDKSHWSYRACARLTAKGGRAWERYAQPPWGSYLSGSDVEQTRRMLWLRYECGSRALAERLQEMIRYWGRLPNQTSYIVEVRGLRIRYWKTLRRGYVLKVNSALYWRSREAEVYKIGGPRCDGLDSLIWTLSQMWRGEYRQRLVAEAKRYERRRQRHRLQKAARRCALGPTLTRSTPPARGR